MSQSPSFKRNRVQALLFHKAWLSDQPGAWSLVLLPSLTALTILGYTARRAIVIVAWLSGYCFIFAFSQWLANRLRKRMLPATCCWAVVCLLCCSLVVMTSPMLVLWAPVFLCIVAVYAVYAWQRKIMSLGAQIAAVVASCVMVLVLASVQTSITFTLSDVRAWLSSFVTLPVVLCACAWFAQEAGTVFHVRSMLRRRQRTVMRRISLLWHVLMVFASVRFPLLTLMAMLLLARTAVLSNIPMRVRVLTIGSIEAVCALGTYAAIIFTVFTSV